MKLITDNLENINGLKLDIQALYDETILLKIKFKNIEHLYSVEMIYEPSRYGNNHRQDCKISSWVDNKWFRTERGSLNIDDRYKSIDDLKQEIISASKKRKLIVENFYFYDAKTVS